MWFESNNAKSTLFQVWVASTNVRLANKKQTRFIVQYRYINKEALIGMTVTNYSNAWKHFKKLIDQGNDNQEAVTIITKTNNAAFISEEEYNQ